MADPILGPNFGPQNGVRLLFFFPVPILGSKNFYISHFFGHADAPSTGRRKHLYSSGFQSQLLLVKSALTGNKRFNRFATMKGPKLDPPGDTILISRGPLSDPFLNTFPLQGGPKLDPQQVESGAFLEVRF